MQSRAKAKGVGARRLGIATAVPAQSCYAIHPKTAFGIDAPEGIVEIEQIVRLKSNGLYAIGALLLKGGSIGREAKGMVRIEPLAESHREASPRVVFPSRGVSIGQEERSASKADEEAVGPLLVRMGRVRQVGAVGGFGEPIAKT